MLVTATATPSSHAFQTCSSNSAPDRRASLAGRTVGDITRPHPVGRLDGEGPLKGIRGYGEPMLGLGGGPPLLHRLGSNTVLAQSAGPRDAHQCGGPV